MFGGYFAIGSYVKIYTLLFPLVLLHLLCYLRKFSVFSICLNLCSTFHRTPFLFSLHSTIWHLAARCKWDVWTLTYFSVVSVYIPLISSFSCHDLVTFFLLCRIFNLHKCKSIHAPILISVQLWKKKNKTPKCTTSWYCPFPISSFEMYIKAKRVSDLQGPFLPCPQNN